MRRMIGKLHMTKRALNVFVYGIIGVLAIVLICAIAATAKGSSSAEKSVKCQWMNSKEQQFTAGVRYRLSREGFRNAGVTLTYVENADGHRDYTVLIHHSRLQDLTEDALEELKVAAVGTGFGANEPYADCTFTVEYLANDF